MAEYKVGDRITVSDHWHGPVAVRTVARVTKVKVVDNKGQEWHVRGRMYGNQSERWYTGRTIEPWKPEHTEEVHRKNAIHYLGKQVWKEMSTTSLKEICDFIESKKGETDATADQS